MERFLYHLSQSAHKNQFILKGAMMLKVWQSPELCPTMDIDFLGMTSNEETTITAQVYDILTVTVEDELIFDPVTIHTERITENSSYKGIRVHRRLRQAHVPEDFADIILSVRNFIGPIIVALTSDEATPSRWTPAGPWV